MHTYLGPGARTPGTPGGPRWYLCSPEAGVSRSDRSLECIERVPGTGIVEDTAATFSETRAVSSSEIRAGHLQRYGGFHH